MYDIQKKDTEGKSFAVFFSKILLNLHFKWRCKPQMHTNRVLFFQNQDTFLQKRVPFLQNQGTFFHFQKLAGETFPLFPASCSPEYTRQEVFEYDYKNFVRNNSARSYHWKLPLILHKRRFIPGEDILIVPIVRFSLKCDP